MALRLHLRGDMRDIFTRFAAVESDGNTIFLPCAKKGAAGRSDLPVFGYLRRPASLRRGIRTFVTKGQTNILRFLAPVSCKTLSQVRRSFVAWLTALISRPCVIGRFQ